MLFLIPAVCSCGGTRDPLTVKSFQLRDQTHERGVEPMVEMEKQRRLLGAISMEERRQRLGQYYTIIWHDASSDAPATITFSYTQGATGSRVKTATHTFSRGETSGKTEFHVTGDDYFKNGRVTSWQATLSRSGNSLASRRSYLWQ